MYSNALITRILLVAPQKNELLKRNKSRVTLWPRNEALIDAYIFQSCRSLEHYKGVVDRAIKMTGLNMASPNDAMTIVNTPSTNNVMDSYSPSGWLVDDENNVYDMIVEVSFVDEELPDINIKTYNAVNVDKESIENPVIICTGVDDILQKSLVEEVEKEPVLKSVPIAARQSQTEDVMLDRMPGKPGRVKHPELDGRLKANKPKS